MFVFTCPDSHVTVVTSGGADVPACETGFGSWTEVPTPFLLQTIPREQVNELLSVQILFVVVIFVSDVIGKAIEGRR